MRHTEVDGAYFADPNKHFLAFRLDGSVAADTVASIYVGYNGWYQPIDVHLPTTLPGNRWFLVADTSSLAVPQQNIFPAGQEMAVADTTYVIQGRSVLIFLER